MDGRSIYFHSEDVVIVVIDAEHSTSHIIAEQLVNSEVRLVNLSEHEVIGANGRVVELLSVQTNLLLYIHDRV